MYRSPPVASGKHVSAAAAIDPRDAWSEPHDTVQSEAARGGGGNSLGRGRSRRGTLCLTTNRNTCIIRGRIPDGDDFDAALAMPAGY